jgi:UDP-N-acetylglucosamine 2-epimerase (non-hydrolysing)
MRIASVVGARPQFVKLAPVHKATVKAGVEHIIIHTGQHYDRAMSDVFFEDLGIPSPNENLAVGSASHGRQTALMLEALESSFLRYRPDWVLVYGDTNSTLAAAIAAVKIHQPLAHLEAGLRSFNRLMPEEHNRVLTDHASDLLLAPTEAAARHLRTEGLGDRVAVVGDVMTDVCISTLLEVRERAPIMPTSWNRADSYIVASIHRQENTESADRLREIVSYLASCRFKVRLIAHPRLRRVAEEFDVDLAVGRIEVLDPISYPQMIYAIDNSAGLVTDSGGLQKEAFILGKPCITLRTETEWGETLVNEWNILSPDCTVTIDDFFNRSRRDSANPYGDGSAAERAVYEMSLRWK